MRDLRKARTYLQGTTHFSDIRLLEVCAIVLFFVFFLYYEQMRFLKLNFGWLERGIRGGSSIISPSSRHRVYRSLLRHIIVPHLFREINADATTAHQLLPILVAIIFRSLPAEDRIEASLSRLFIHHLCACLCFSFLNCLFATACVFYPELYKDCMSVFTEERFFFTEENQFFLLL